MADPKLQQRQPTPNEVAAEITFRNDEKSTLSEAERKKDEDQELLPGLTPDLETKLIQLAVEFEQESYGTWRFLYRNFLEAESFWKDLQYGYFDYSSDVYRLPSFQDWRRIDDSVTQFQFVTNLYRAFGWTILSILGQKVPNVVFLPEDYQNEDDVIAARAASDVVPLIERNNDVPVLNMRTIYYLYCDGIVGGYVRYVVDGDRFGFKEEKEFELVSKKIAKPHYECANCGHYGVSDEDEDEQAGGVNQAGDTFPSLGASKASPMGMLGGMQPLGSVSSMGSIGPMGDQFAPQKEMPRVSGAFTFAPKQASGQTCEKCGKPLTPDEMFESEEGEVPRVKSVKRIPKGQELITIHGGLELRLPPWLRYQGDYPYLGMAHEEHLSQLRATYGQRARFLQGGTGGPYDTWDRFARLMLTEPYGGAYYSLANQNLVTTKSYWFRPSSFYRLGEDERQKLLEIFPHGAYFKYGNENRLLDARDENMDDHWTICHAIEGAANYSPALGQSVLSVQKRYNTLHNFIMEWVEYAAAGQGTIVNVGALSINALRKQRRAPGMLYPVSLPPNVPISNAIYDSRPGAIANEVFTYTQNLVQVGQLLSGSVPTVSGGTDKNLKPTTYLTDREQALGKLYVPWQNLRHFWAKVMLNAVKEFAKCREDDEAYSIQGDDGTQVEKVVHLDRLQGSFDAYPEVNEDFPRLLHQQQALFLTLLQSNDPTTRQMLSDPRNLPYLKNLFGWPRIFVPGEQNILKQKTENTRLLAAKPEVQQDPQTGQVTFVPSILPDQFADNHALHIEVVREWAVSDEGMRMKDENPQGYANVIAHGMFHQRILEQQQQAQQQAAMQAEVQQQGQKIAMSQMTTKNVTQELKGPQGPQAPSGAQAPVAQPQIAQPGPQG